jgi:hypothetical protein
MCMVMLCALQTKACDICGCGISNFNPYLFPHLSKNYVGVNYLHRIFRTTANNGTVSREQYNSILFSMQFSPIKKIQITTQIPYVFNSMSFAQVKRIGNGLGDASVLINYNIWQKMTLKERHNLTLSTGVKMRTGKYVAAKEDNIAEHNFQLGSGSTDFLVSGSYRYALPKWVFSAVSSYKYNTQNADGYRLGDVWTNGVTVIYRKDLANISLLPYLQIMNEQQMQDADDHTLINHSGGNVLYTGGGIDLSSKKITVGVNYQFAVAQNLAKGQIDVKPRLSAHFSFTF